MYWKVRFATDNGYGLFAGVCIIEARDREDAEENFNEWIKYKLMPNETLLLNRTSFRPIRIGSNGVIYSNLNGYSKSEF